MTSLARLFPVSLDRGISALLRDARRSCDDSVLLSQQRLSPIVSINENPALDFQPTAAETPIQNGVFVPIGFAAALILCLSGCRGAAYRDVYTQKMSSEIRNLEDQLYDADYQNQVLRDQLASAEARAAQVMVPQSARPSRTIFGRTLNESGEVIDTRDNRIAPPSSRPLPRRSDTKSPELAPPALPARPLDNAKTLEPPGEPVPPGRNDLMVPDVELGEPTPPSSELPDSLPEFQPGQIKLPETAKILGTSKLAEPVAIRINNGLSGGHKSDDASATEGIELLIEAIDDAGKTVDLTKFDIDANLSVVLLDPSRPGSESRLGKWDFGPEKIREMLNSTSDSALHTGRLHVVIPWGDARPEASVVIAHVRLSADEVIMQTQGEIATVQATAANWTPRASTTR